MENAITEYVFLSFCIPTYDRADKVVALVKSILTYQEKDIEVVVLNNCSTDDTEFLLKEITDKRFKYLKNEKNIGGISNVLMALSYAKGEFVFLCLDKDYINPKNIKLFFNRLQEDKEVAFGQCSLNTNDISNDLIYDKGIASTINIAYTSEHPSGLFFKNNLLKENNIISGLLPKFDSFALVPELLKAEFSIVGKSRRINIPFVYTETREECAKEISHTYKGENIYFLPKNVIKSFNIYANHLYGLDLKKEDKRLVLKKIYVSNLFSSTFGFKKIMQDDNICTHHSIATRSVSYFELTKIYIKYNYNFFSTNIPENFCWKVVLFCEFHLSTIMSLFLKFRKNGRRK